MPERRSPRPSRWTPHWPSSFKNVTAATILVVAGPWAASAEDPVRGITISTHRGGLEWGTDVIVPTLERIEDLGASWVAIHPYARIHEDGSVVSRGDGGGEHITRPIREAHALGLRILIKPHLAYWGSPFSWRGEIEFESPEEWNRFFESYTAWIRSVADAAHAADAFAVGTELDATLSYERQWRALISEVRSVFGGRLTYAANWTDYQAVPFWNALDVIGIQAYFPISDLATADEEKLAAGWERILGELRSFAEPLDKKVLFTELGYDRSYDAAVRPWESGNGEEGAAAPQEACLRVALDIIEQEPLVEGVFLWKWFPEPRPMGRDFQLAAPGMQTVIRHAWR